MITLTPEASKELKQIAAAEGLEEQFVRLSIKGGGCAGFTYDMCFIPLSDDNDEVFTIDGIKFAIDSISIQYFEDTTVDYIDSLIGAGFKFLNPKATGSCGCGNSVSF